MASRLLPDVRSGDDNFEPASVCAFAACGKITSLRAAGSNGDDKTPVYEQLLLLSRLN